MPDPQTDEKLESFLRYLSSSRGFDFTAYKRGTLTRRFEKRMQEVGAASYNDYIEYLELNPDEFTALFNTVLINVTSFFRDPAVWELLARDVVPRIVANKTPHEPIRIWSAGCASGEEAYTLAILFAEAMEPADFQQRVKIYGTDVDEDALTTARRAEYPERAIEAVPDALREKYFDRTALGYAFRKPIRRQVVFGRLDLLQDAPISRVDVLACRNTLMYFNAEAQARVLARFLFALSEQGFLLLGKAETLLAHASLVVPVDLKLRVFAKAPRSRRRAPLVPATRAEDATDGRPSESPSELRDLAFELDPVAQMTVDSGGRVSSINELARRLFELRQTDVGRLLQDLRISHKPTDIRSLVETSMQERRAVVASDVEWTAASGKQHWFSVHVTPLFADDAPRGVNFSFIDHTSEKELQQELDKLHSELETAYEELQSSSEELETTNEELQSTVEELETTNEELQSTNEELETMNEELQSTNSELETVNNDIRSRGVDLERANGFLQTILSALQMGVTVVDRDFTVEAWNAAAAELWGLREDEVIGRNFLSLDIGLPVDELKQLVRDCIDSGDGRTELQLTATNRRGRQITCLVSCMPFRSSSVPSSAVLLMEPSAVPRGD